MTKKWLIFLLIIIVLSHIALADCTPPEKAGRQGCQFSQDSFDELSGEAQVNYALGQSPPKTELIKPDNAAAWDHILSKKKGMISEFKVDQIPPYALEDSMDLINREIKPVDLTDDQWTYISQNPDMRYEMGDLGDFEADKLETTFGISAESFI